MSTVMIRRVLDSIDTEEVKLGAEEAVTIMHTADDDAVRKAAKQTYVALARFGTHLQEAQEVRPRSIMLEGDEQENLKSIITESGIAYFGPMFKSGGILTPLHDKDKIFKEMVGRGYNVTPLHHLTDTQLDMLFTKILESGLLRDFNTAQPQA